MSIRDTRDDIIAMRIRGAAAIGSAAAKALGRHVADTPGDMDSVRSALHMGAAMLRASRPTAVPLMHAIRSVVEEVEGAHSADEARKSALKAATRFVRATEAGQKAVIDHAAKTAAASPIIMTHCHSSTVVDALIQANKRAPLEVFATETRPWRQGAITAKALHDAGIDVTLIVDSAAPSVMVDRGIQQIMVGADTVAFDGTLFNKVGTRGLALAAREAGIPFRSAANRFKFSPWRPAKIEIELRDASEILEGLDLPPGIQAYNPVFDQTPPEWITAYITERGPLGPLHAVKSTGLVLA